MIRARMIVVAGPPGSGKTSSFPVTAFGVDAFNIDDRCAQILGSYRAIPRHVRRAVARECERFVQDHIAAGHSFAVETTLRTKAAIEQAQFARARGFATEMIFVATDSIDENIARIVQRPRRRARRVGTRGAGDPRSQPRTWAPRSMLSSASTSTTRLPYGRHHGWLLRRTMVGSTASASVRTGSRMRSRCQNPDIVYSRSSMAVVRLRSEEG